MSNNMKVFFLFCGNLTVPEDIMKQSSKDYKKSKIGMVHYRKKLLE